LVSQAKAKAGSFVLALVVLLWIMYAVGVYLKSNGGGGVNNFSANKDGSVCPAEYPNYDPSNSYCYQYPNDGGGSVPHGCYACVTITGIYYGVMSPGGQTPGPCVDDGWQEGNLGMVIGPNQQSGRTFTDHVEYSTAYGNVGGYNCSGYYRLSGISTIYLSVVQIQSTSPSFPTGCEPAGYQWKLALTYYVPYPDYQNGPFNVEMSVVKC
jgi:hypothetical protein